MDEISDADIRKSSHFYLYKSTKIIMKFSFISNHTLRSYYAAFLLRSDISARLRLRAAARGNDAMLRERAVVDARRRSSRLIVSETKPLFSRV